MMIGSLKAPQELGSTSKSALLQLIQSTQSSVVEWIWLRGLEDTVKRYSSAPFSYIQHVALTIRTGDALLAKNALTQLSSPSNRTIEAFLVEFNQETWANATPTLHGASKGFHKDVEDLVVLHASGGRISKYVEDHMIAFIKADDNPPSQAVQFQSRLTSHVG